MLVFVLLSPLISMTVDEEENEKKTLCENSGVQKRTYTNIGHNNRQEDDRKKNRNFQFVVYFFPFS
jgi:hypothetical protein